jgi:3-oxoacyl-[acyl-carrier-protein] synthase II
MNTGEATARTVVSGVGVVSPIGIGNPAFWNSLMEGRSGVAFLRAFSTHNLPTHFAAEVQDFDPLIYLPQRKFLKVMSRGIQLGVAAATLAAEDARLRAGDVDPDRLGVVYGAGRISTTPEELADAVRNFGEKRIPFDEKGWGEADMSRIAPLWLLRQLPNMPACLVSIELDARGPNNTITSRDSSAILALMEAVNVIERGAADCMIVGACSSNIQPVDVAKFCLFEELSRRDADPESASRPFDLKREGTILGEGAAAFVVESLKHATIRGAEIYAEIIGTGAGCDGHETAERDSGAGLAHAIRGALQTARLAPAQLGHINADGKSTQTDDVVEARAIHRALGEAAVRVPVTALKSYFGSFDAGSGAVELAGSLLALKHGRVPPTLNYQFPDPRCRLNIIHEGPMDPSHPSALCVNRTRIGQSAAVVLRTL